MIVLIAGILSLTLWFGSFIKPRAKHSSRGFRMRSRVSSEPSFFKVAWFFLSVVAIIAGYVLLATG